MGSVIQYFENNLATCGFKSHFGFDCPGCGMQRAAISLMRGEVVESLQYNPGLIPFLFVIVFTALHLIFKFEKGGSVLVWGYCITLGILLVNYTLKMTGIISGHP
jgi:hypothetical protein